jgi:gas vesicle protein
MLLPIKFIAANIFLSGMTAGAVCGAIAVYTLSDPEGLNRLNDYVKKMCKGCKK